MSAAATILRRHWQIAAMPLMFFIAWIWPEVGAKGGWLHAEVTTKAVVALTFVLMGLGLPLAELKAGLKEWRLHVVVQAWIFLAFPLLGWSVLAVIGMGMDVPPELRRGLLYLSVLPTTISTAVVLTAQAGGRTAAALFNALFSNLAGVLLTPLWVAALLSQHGETRGLVDVMVELIQLMLLPFVLGHLGRIWFARWADGKKAVFSAIASAGILFLLFATFCDAVKSEVYARTGWTITLEALGGAVVLLGLATLLTRATARALKLSRADEWALVFCGSQKTLAVGVPLAALIFGAGGELGVLLLPLMIYHPLQLLLGVWLAARGR